MAERDGKQPPERPDYLADFPEEFEQRPDGPPRDLARRARREAPRSEPKAREVHRGRAAKPPAPDSALARIEEMKRRVEELARKERRKADED